MAIQRKIQLYVSDASGGQKTAKYYRIPLPADNLPFDKNTNLFKNMIHFYCTISGDSATFGAIGFADQLVGIYDSLSAHAGSYVSEESLKNYANITPSIPEKLLNDGELSFDVYGSTDSIHYNSADGFQHSANNIFKSPNADQANYLNKIVKKSGIFRSNNVIRSNSENELSQFVPSNWQEFDSMDELLADVRKRINDAKTLVRGDFGTYEEITSETNNKFDPNQFTVNAPFATFNEFKRIELYTTDLTGSSTLTTHCDGHQQILIIDGQLQSNDIKLEVDTAILSDEITIIQYDPFSSNQHQIYRIQPNSGKFNLGEKLGNRGTGIIFKNKADSANLVIAITEAAKAIDMLVELVKRESTTKEEFRQVLREVHMEDLVPSGVAMPPHMNRTNVPLTDFIQIKGNENFLLLDVDNDNVTFKFTPGTKFRLLVKSSNYNGSEIDVDNSTGTFEANIIAYSDGVAAGAKLFLVKYDTTDITVSW